MIPIIIGISPSPLFSHFLPTFRAHSTELCAMDDTLQQVHAPLSFNLHLSSIHPLPAGAKLCSTIVDEGLLVSIDHTLHIVAVFTLAWGLSDVWLHQYSQYLAYQNVELFQGSGAVWEGHNDEVVELVVDVWEVFPPRSIARQLGLPNSMK